MTIEQRLEGVEKSLVREKRRNRVLFACVVFAISAAGATGFLGYQQRASADDVLTTYFDTSDPDHLILKRDLWIRDGGISIFRGPENIRRVSIDASDTSGTFTVYHDHTGSRMTRWGIEREPAVLEGKIIVRNGYDYTVIKNK